MLPYSRSDAAQQEGGSKVFSSTHETPATQLETELSLGLGRVPLVILRAPVISRAVGLLPSVFSNYCGGSLDLPDADAALTDRIHVIIAHISASVLTTSPIGGIGPTTFSEPWRL